jgi:hypothetical protein
MAIQASVRSAPAAAEALMKRFPLLLCRYNHRYADRWSGFTRRNCHLHHFW